MADHGTNFFVSVVGRLQSTIWKFRSPKRTSERYNVIIYNILIISLFAQIILYIYDYNTVKPPKQRTLWEQYKFSCFVPYREV